jgi:Gluconate 2-dehydrogenase subunit 3
VRVLDPEQRASLRSILNQVVPANGTLPGAGDLDVGASIERTLHESPRLRRLFIDGLTQIAIAAHRQSGSAFAELEPARQLHVLKMVEHESPAFFEELVEHTYRGYYTLPAVQRAVGVEPRPPQPLGYKLEPFDPALLEQQRQRSPFWRRTS